MQYYEQYRSKKIDAHRAAQNSPDNNYALTPTDMVGIFTIYSVFFIAAGAISMYRRHKKEDDEPSDQPKADEAPMTPEAPLADI